MTLDELQINLNNLDIEQLCEDTLHSNRNEVSKVVREQLSEGEGGNSPMPFYSPKTKGKSGRIKLYETGDFYQGIGAIVESGSVYISSDDEKGSMLEEIYQEQDPLKMNENSILELGKVLQPTLVELVEQRLGL